jgi:hypothetical protein
MTDAADEQSKPTSVEPECREISDEELRYILKDHDKWLAAEDKTGLEHLGANLSRAEFQDSTVAPPTSGRPSLCAHNDSLGASGRCAKFYPMRPGTFLRARADPAVSTAIACSSPISIGIWRESVFAPERGVAG